MSYATSIKEATTMPMLPIAVGTTLASFAFNALGVYGDARGGAASTREFLVVCGIAIAASAVVFGLVVPRSLGTRGAGRSAVILSALALLTIPVFWAGITPALGVGGIVLGLSSDRRLPARIGVAVGALALMAYVAVYVSDWLSTNGYL